MVEQLVRLFSRQFEKRVIGDVLTVPGIYQTDEGVCIEPTEFCVQFEASGPGVKPVECSSRKVK